MESLLTECCQFCFGCQKPRLHSTLPKCFDRHKRENAKIMCPDVLISVCLHVLHSSHFLSTVHSLVNSEHFCLLKEQNCGIFCSNCDKNIKMIPLSALNIDAFQYFQNRQRWNKQKQSPNSCFKYCSLSQDNIEEVGLPLLWSMRIQKHRTTSNEHCNIHGFNYSVLSWTIIAVRIISSVGIAIANSAIRNWNGKCWRNEKSEGISGRSFSKWRDYLIDKEKEK